MKYNVTFHIKGHDYNTGRDDGDLTFEAKIDFRCNPEDYGNGYYMGVKSKAEPFGFSSYDIRYDGRFREDDKIGYIVQHYCGKYDGKDGAWKLVGISVEEVEE